VTDLSITEEAFDVALNPIRAKVSLGLRVLSVDDLGFKHRGGTLFMAYLRNKESLAGQATHIQVDYISMLAMAQKGIATAGIEKLWAFAGNLAAVKPDILDKLNSDQTIDEYASALGVSPKIIVSDEDAAKARQGRAQQAQMAQATEMAATAAQGAKTLSETDVGGGINAMQMMLGNAAAPTQGT